MRRIIGSLVASLAVMAMLVSGGLTPASAKEQQVPFKAHFSGDLSFTDASHIQLIGTGDASHLGRSTSNTTIANVGPAACEGGFAVESEETLTAANGDQLRWTVDDEACPTATPMVFRISGAYTVVGGTGRFAGATGQGTIDCLGDFVNGTFDFTVTGTISRH